MEENRVTEEQVETLFKEKIKPVVKKTSSTVVNAVLIGVGIAITNNILKKKGRK